MASRPVSLVTVLLAALLLAACGSAGGSINDEPSPDPALKIAFLGAPSARFDQAMRATQISVDLEISNPSIYDIEIDRVWILVKDARGDNAHVEAIESDSLREMWKEPRVPARARRRVPARFYVDAMPVMSNGPIPIQPDAVRLEAWVEGTDPKGGDVRAQAEYRQPIAGVRGDPGAAFTPVN